MQPSSDPLVQNLGQSIPAKIRGTIAITNRFFTVAVVLGMLVLGAIAVHLFLDLYSPQYQERKVSTYLIDGTDDALSPNAIHRAIRQAQLEDGRSQPNRDPSKPLWLLLEASASTMRTEQSVVFDIRSIHASSFRFWLIPLDRSAPTQEITHLASASDGGLYINVPKQPDSYDIVGSLKTGFLFKPKVLVWENASPEQLSKRFSKTGVAVWSVFLALASFSLCVAAVNKSFLFLIFSAWLIASIRVAGFNNGWDFNWLGVDQWDGTPLKLVRMSISAYAFLTCVLFTSLFGQALRRSYINKGMAISILAFGLLIAFGNFMPIDLYVTVFRSFAATALLLIAAGIIKLLRTSPSPIAWLYAGSYALMITGMMIEILFQENVVPALGDMGINATGGSLASAIVMSVALAAQIREERSARVRARLGEVNALKELEGVYSQTPVGLFSVSADGSLTNANPMFRQMFALGSNSKTSLRFKQLWAQGLAPLCGTVDLDAPKKGVEVSLLNGDENKTQWYVVNVAHNADGFAGSIADVTARKTAEGKLEYLARHDAVTGALNVHGFERLVDQRLKSGELAILGQISIERAEYIHKIHGRILAEGVLIEVVKLIRASVPDAHLARDNDKLYLLLDGDSINQVKGALSAAFRKIKQTGVTIGSVELMPVLKAGLCLLDRDRNAAEAMLRANLASEMAQGSATQSILVAEHNENDIIRELEATRVATGLDDYIKAGRFFLVAQPIVDIRRENPKPAFELLLRMRGEGGETISPWQFIPAAEKMGVMSTLDRFVLAEAFRLVKSGELNLDQISYLSVNLSGSSLNDMQFLGDVYDLVTTTNINLSNICFEVTESVALNSFDRTKEFLSALQQLGAKTAIDDFGAGHSSIHYLTELHPDYLKLDGSLITKVLTNPIHRSYVRKMVELADEMEVSCVGEFVETPELEAALIDLGVKMGQGYYYAAPMPSHQVSEYCAKWAAQMCIDKVIQQPIKSTS